MVRKETGKSQTLNCLTKCNVDVEEVSSYLPFMFIITQYGENFKVKTSLYAAVISLNLGFMLVLNLGLKDYSVRGQVAGRGSKLGSILTLYSKG